MAPADKPAEKAKKDGGGKALLIAAVILTLVAAAGGWVLGAQISKEIAPPSSPKAAEQEENQGNVISANSNVTVLPPILTNMAAPNTAWIRIEVALVAQPGEIVSPALASEISNDFLAFIRESTIAQIKGPSGLLNLREDLLDRARIRSDGKISNVLISSLVIEQ